MLLILIEYGNSLISFVVIILKSSGKLIKIKSKLEKWIKLFCLSAPLAPIFHYNFFYSPDKIRAIVNIGGISNITLLN